jgi:hypothetical protein
LRGSPKKKKNNKTEEQQQLNSGQHGFIFFAHVLSFLDRWLVLLTMEQPKFGSF